MAVYMPGTDEVSRWTNQNVIKKVLKKRHRSKKWNEQVQKLVLSDALAAHSWQLVDTVDIVDIVDIFDIVDIVNIVDIVDNIDIVDTVDTVDTVDIVDIAEIVDIVDIDPTIYWHCCVNLKK